MHALTAVLVASNMDLTSAYLDSLAPEVAARVSRDAVAAELAAMCVAARAAVPAVASMQIAFVRALAAHATDGMPPPREHAPDLALAFACTIGDASALRAIDPVIASSVAAAIARINRAPSFAHAVERELRAQVFAQHRLREYAGRAPLRAWLRAAAMRIALSLRRGRLAARA